MKQASVYIGVLLAAGIGLLNPSALEGTSHFDRGFAWLWASTVGYWAYPAPPTNDEPIKAPETQPTDPLTEWIKKRDRFRKDRKKFYQRVDLFNSTRYQWVCYKEKMMTYDKLCREREKALAEEINLFQKKKIKCPQQKSCLENRRIELLFCKQDTQKLLRQFEKKINDMCVQWDALNERQNHLLQIHKELTDQRLVLEKKGLKPPVEKL